MKIKEVYYRENVDSYVVVEDQAGSLSRCYLGTPRIVPVPHEPRAGLQKYDPIFRKGMALGLRTLGHEVLD